LFPWWLWGLTTLQSPSTSGSSRRGPIKLLTTLYWDPTAGRAQRSSCPGSGVCWNIARRRSARSEAVSITVAEEGVDLRLTRVEVVALRMREVEVATLPGPAVVEPLGVDCPALRAEARAVVVACSGAVAVARPGVAREVGVAEVRPHLGVRSAAE